MFPRSLIRSALHVDHEFEHGDALILRDHLALIRTRLANERTLLSYIRSTLYLLLGGVALLKIEGYGDLRLVGYIALAVSALFVIIGTYRYVTLRRQLAAFYMKQVAARSAAK